MFAERRERIQTLAWQIGIGVFLALLWELLALRSARFAFLASSPSKIALEWWRLAGNGSLLPAVGISSFEAITGLAIGTALGCSMGLGLWFSESVARIARPYVIGLSSVPLFVFAPVLILSLGTGLSLKIFIASVGTTFIALSQAYVGAQSVAPKMLEEAKGLGASNGKIFRLVVAPGSVEWVLNSIRLNVGAALLGAFIGEFISSQRGLGYLVIRESGLYNVAGAFASGITIVALALTMNAAASIVEKRRALLIQYVSVAKAVRRYGVPKRQRWWHRTFR